jgi:hypothetical protein
MVLISTLISPPGNWVYQEARSGHWSGGTTFMDLVRKVSQHRKNMNYAQATPPFSSLSDEIEDWLCKRLAPDSQDALCTGGTRAVVMQPGDLLAILLKKITGKNAATCGQCAVRMQKMNSWGWLECWVRRHEIIGWLSEEAASRGHPISEDAVWSLFKAGWHELGQKES